MDKIKLFEDFVPAGFGGNTTATFSLSGGRNIGTGYNMDAIVGPVMHLGNCVAKEAQAYETNDNPEHTAESYIKEAKKHINEKIDEACESYSAMSEAMVQIAGDKKPSGAQVLATVLIDYMIEKDYLKPGADRAKKALVEDIKKFIMDNTF
jgi:hypothetical protein